MTIRISGTGSALPEKVITNDDLSKIVETNDEWISSRTGIRQRRIAGKGESVVTRGSEAARRALENAGAEAGEIDLILVATCSGESYFPSTACQIQAEIHADRAVAFDISAACSGFLFALHTAQAYLSMGVYKKALVIGAETLSRVIDWTDRGSCVLFGDGAGACVVETAETGLMNWVQHSDGSQGGVLVSHASTFPTPSEPDGHPAVPLQMDGQAVFKFAVKTVPQCIEQVLEQAGVDREQIKYFVLHQANKRIIQSVAKRLKVEEEKFPVNLDRRGNTSAASIPILLDEMNREGMLTRGDLLVLSGFGAGLTWAAALLTW